MKILDARVIICGPGLRAPSFGIQEYMRHREEPTGLFRTHTISRSDSCSPATGPEIGVDINEAQAAQYPYPRACLSIKRGLNRTMYR